jgi:predicted dehydrogenase
MSKVEVVAVASRNLQAAKVFTQECGIPQAYGSYQELMEQANAYALMVQEMQHAIEEQKPLPITLEDSMETMAIIDRLFTPNNDDYWVENP